jgi:hypothetical protein
MSLVRLAAGQLLAPMTKAFCDGFSCLSNSGNHTETAFADLIPTSAARRPWPTDKD